MLMDREKTKVNQWGKVKWELKQFIKKTVDIYLALTCASRVSSVGSLRSSFVLPFSVNRLTYMSIKVRERLRRIKQKYII